LWTTAEHFASQKLDMRVAMVSHEGFAEKPSMLPCSSFFEQSTQSVIAHPVFPVSAPKRAIPMSPEPPSVQIAVPLAQSHVDPVF
jgi:hypothetical protein